MVEKKEKTEAKSSGVYLSNFVATSIALFILVLAFAAGFFAKAYFGETPQGTVNNAAQVVGAENQPNQVTVSFAQIKDIFSKNVIKFGDAGRKVLFVEVSDPSCPYCAIAAGKNGELNKQVGSNFTLVKDGGTYEAPVEEMKKLVDEGKASFAYIYRPGHGNGELATKALYCAYDAGKFWEVHNLLMNAEGYNLLNNTVKNDKSKIDTLVAFLNPAMNSAELKSCLESGKYDKRPQEDTALSDTLGVSGTPGFFVNDKLFAGAYSYVEMRSTVDSLLK